MSNQPVDPRFVEVPGDSKVRDRIQKAEQNRQLRPGALCPNCSGHAFRRAELKNGAACPRCGKTPKLAA